MAWGSSYNSVLTIHLSLIGQDNLPPSARRIDGQGLLEALLNLRAPHSLRIVVCRLVCRVAHPLHVLGRAFAAAPAAGINRGGWALQAGAWSRLGRNLEFPNTQRTKLLLSTTELGTVGSKTQHNAQWEHRSGQTSLAFAKDIVDLEEMDRVKTLDTGHDFKLSNQGSAVESLKALGELSRAQYFYRKLHEKRNHGIWWGSKYARYEDSHWTL